MYCLPIGIDCWLTIYNGWGSVLTSKEAIAAYIAAAGVAVSVITYIFQRRQLKLNALVEVFKVLNLPSHREARRVSYGKGSDGSYDLLKVKRPDEDGAIVGELERISADIVRGDMNNAATLINHHLMDGSIFLEEYWWIILRCWDNVKDIVFERRKSGTGASGYMHNLQTLNDRAEKYAKEHHSTDYVEYLQKYRTKTKKEPIDTP